MFFEELPLIEKELPQNEPIVSGEQDFPQPQFVNEEEEEMMLQQQMMMLQQQQLISLQILARQQQILAQAKQQAGVLTVKTDAGDMQDPKTTTDNKESTDDPKTNGATDENDNSTLYEKQIIELQKQRLAAKNQQAGQQVSQQVDANGTNPLAQQPPVQLPTEPGLAVNNAALLFANQQTLILPQVSAAAGLPQVTNAASTMMNNAVSGAANSTVTAFSQPPPHQPPKPVNQFSDSLLDDEEAPQSFASLIGNIHADPLSEDFQKRNKYGREITDADRPEHMRGKYDEEKGKGKGRNHPDYVPPPPPEDGEGHAPLVPHMFKDRTDYKKYEDDYSSDGGSLIGADAVDIAMVKDLDRDHVRAMRREARERERAALRSGRGGGKGKGKDRDFWEHGTGAKIRTERENRRLAARFGEDYVKEKIEREEKERRDKEAGTQDPETLRDAGRVRSRSRARDRDRAARGKGRGKFDRDEVIYMICPSCMMEGTFKFCTQCGTEMNVNMGVGSVGAIDLKEIDKEDFQEFGEGDKHDKDASKRPGRSDRGENDSEADEKEVDGIDGEKYDEDDNDGEELNSEDEEMLLANKFGCKMSIDILYSMWKIYEFPAMWKIYAVIMFNFDLINKMTTFHTKY